MAEQSKKPAVTKPLADSVAGDVPAGRPATKKAVPAANAEVAAVAAVAASEPAKAVKPKTARAPSKVQETVAKHQQVLAEALEMAQAIRYDVSPADGAGTDGAANDAKPAKAPRADKEPKPEKPAKPKKLKLVRDSYAMPEAEYARIGELKKRLAALGLEVKKSELLRAGVAALSALDDGALQAVMAGVERIKTGRPAK